MKRVGSQNPFLENFPKFIKPSLKVEIPYIPGKIETFWTQSHGGLEADFPWCLGSMLIFSLYFRLAAIIRAANRYGVSPQLPFHPADLPRPRVSAWFFKKGENCHGNLSGPPPALPRFTPWSKALRNAKKNQPYFLNCGGFFRGLNFFPDLDSNQRQQWSKVRIFFSSTQRQVFEDHILGLPPTQ